MTRPSNRYATIVSDVILTSRIRGSALATMLMPCLQNRIVMNFNQSPYHVQLPGSKAVICCKLKGVKPEFARPVFPSNVHMNRLVTVKAVKEEPVRSRDVLNSRHSIVPQFSLIRYHVYVTYSLASSHLTYSVLSLKAGGNQALKNVVWFDGRIKRVELNRVAAVQRRLWGLYHGAAGPGIASGWM